MTRPLCSAGITPLRRYYGAVRPSPRALSSRARGGPAQGSVASERLCAQRRCAAPTAPPSLPLAPRSALAPPIGQRREGARSDCINHRIGRPTIQPPPAYCQTLTAPRRWAGREAKEDRAPKGGEGSDSDRVAPDAAPRLTAPRAIPNINALCAEQVIAS